MLDRQRRVELAILSLVIALTVDLPNDRYSQDKYPAALMHPETAQVDIVNSQAVGNGANLLI